MVSGFGFRVSDSGGYGDDGLCFEVKGSGLGVLGFRVVVRQSTHVS
jgi:hypothetical protein